MSDTLTIIQPGRIGDIIICLPIANYLRRKYKRILWPIAEAFYPMFSRVVDYVEFKPVQGGLCQWRDRSLQLAQGDVLDHAFGILPLDEAWEKWRASGIPFDEYKYRLAGVPFDEKWNLKINRDFHSELAINVGRTPYLLYQRFSSDSQANIEWKPDEEPMYKVEITALTDSVFDWIGALELASKLVLVDSCFVNLVEGLGINTRKRRLRKEGYDLDHDYPVLRNEWEEK